MAFSCAQLFLDENVAAAGSFTTSAAGSSSASAAMVRKSGRLAGKEKVHQQKPNYVSQKYSYTDKWCEECQQASPTECIQHSLTTVPDKVVLPRAFASLPALLVISEIKFPTEGHAHDSSKTRALRKSVKNISAGSNLGCLESNVVADDSVAVNSPDCSADAITYGIFARRALPTRTKFGPLVCRFINAEEESSRPQPFHLMLEKSDGRIERADTTDEDFCNWMMFVRPARSAEEQNLVAFQQENDIYYVTTRNILQGQELKVWYANHYAERLGIPVFGEKLELKTDVDNDKTDDVALDNTDWPSYECSDRFPTEALLQKHLIIHDRAPISGSGQRCKSKKRGKRRIFEKKKCHDDDGGGGEKKEDEVEGCGGGDDDDASYCPSIKRKKPVTRFSLSSKKKREAESGKPDGDKSDSKETKSQKWSCQYCDLVFNGASVLNIHTLVHAAENALGAGEDQSGNGDWCKLEKGSCDHLDRDATRSVIGGGRDQNDDAGGFVDSLSRQAESTNDHLSLMSLTCPVCKQDFETKTALVLHSSQHAETRQSLAQLRPFKCQLCLKTFRTFEKLQQHLLCHGDESMKPHPCEVCSRRFMNSAALAVHMKTHGERKYYACPLCPESFDQVHQLRQHAEERHLERTINSRERTDERIEDKENCDLKTVGDGFARVGRHVLVESSDVDAAVPDAGNSNVASFTFNVLSGTTSASNQDLSVWQPNAFCSVDSSAVPTTTVATMDGGYGIGSCLFVEEIATVSGTQLSNYGKALTGDVDLQQYLEPQDIEDVETVFVSEFSGTSASVKETDISPHPGADESASKTCSVKNGNKIDGTYSCPDCHRAFTEFSAVSRHVRIAHSGRSFDCSDCGRSFPSRDKLRLHSLRHSTHREFVCETCGRQFKRKDKLKDHLRKQHDPSKECRTTSQNVSGQGKRNQDAGTFAAAVSPHDFTKFPFKCQKCLLGFKRRGMLINHMAKKHPDVSLDSVPELKLPILTSKYNFFCQYCNKVFKSSSKRKFHILKHHPGFELPAPLRSRKASDGSHSDQRTANGFWSFSSQPTFSTPSGHSASEPHPCSLCHRQYASRSKLVQHQRKKHHPHTNEISDAARLSDRAENSSSVVQSSNVENSEETNETVTTASPFQVDCGQFFVGTSVFFAPKVNGSLDFASENDQSDNRNVLLLSSGSENLLVDDSAQLSYVKPLQSAGSKQQTELSYSAKQQHQTVIIDPDLFAQAMRELTKSYAAKNSSFTCYDLRPQEDLVRNNDNRHDDSGGHQLLDIVSLTVDVSDFGSDRHEDQSADVQLLQTAMPASVSPVTSQSFIVDWGISNALVRDSSDADSCKKI